MVNWELEWFEGDLEHCWTKLRIMWRSGWIKEQLASRVDMRFTTQTEELEVANWDGWREVWGGCAIDYGQGSGRS